MSRKNYGQTIETIAKDVAEIKGSVNTLALRHQHTAEEVKKVEGRQWGLAVAVLIAFISGFLALAARSWAAASPRSAIHAIYEFFSF